MKVLLAASEAVPFIKTGGLADVMGALPAKLRREGVETALVIPKYSRVAERFGSQMETVWEGTVDLAWRRQYVGVEKIVLDGVPVFFIDNEYYFKRDGLYGFYDDGERFAYFCRALLAMLPHIGFRPDVIHSNDWHTGLVGVYLKEDFQKDSFYQGMKSLFTVHNMKYQGIFSPEVVEDVLGLSRSLFDSGRIENNGAAVCHQLPRQRGRGEHRKSFLCGGNPVSLFRGRAGRVCAALPGENHRHPQRYGRKGL